MLSFFLAEGSLKDLLPYDIHCKYKRIHAWKPGAASSGMDKQ